MTIATLQATWISAVTIHNGNTAPGTEQDLLGNNTSCARGLVFWLDYTSTAAAGTIDVTVWFNRTIGTDDKDQAPVIFSEVPIIGTQHILLGGVYSQIIFPTRFVNLQVTNNGVGADLTGVTITGGYTQFS